MAEVGKISEAAQTLFISSPALSTSIHRLEKELGCKLFDRTNNRITLNQQGRILLRYANRVFAELDCAKAELKQSILQQGHHVSLATVASTQWVDMITAFTQEYPGFTLLCTSVRRQELLGGLSSQHSFLLGAECDLPAHYLEKLDSTFLFEDHPMLMVSATHRLAGKTSVELSQLTGLPIYLPMPDYPLYENLVTLFENSGMPFPEGNGYSHLSLQHMVAGGMGVSFATGKHE